MDLSHLTLEPSSRSLGHRVLGRTETQGVEQDPEAPRIFGNVTETVSVGKKININKYNYFCIYFVCMMYVCMYLACTWRSKDNLQELVLSFCHMGVRN